MRERLRRLKPGWNTFVPPFYWTAVTALRGALWLIGRWTVTGREHVPPEGAFMVVSNHLSNADPPILSAGIAKRRIRFMAKVELFKYPFGAAIRLYGAFPVRRFDADVAALMAAERSLRHGEVLGMFPEGHRSRTGYVGKPHPGTALIALRSGATVLPCAMIGTEQLRKPLNLLKRPRITIHIGEPMVVEKVKRPTEEQVSALTERIFDEITALLPAKYLAAYTGSEGAADSNHGADNPGQ
ncbi:MAG: 1-acyl-sn-glycerol-3-phosphate acyltransferase [Dehalococcoidia bacterium]|nr:1-acyl-sn-glycerol-3-phosphate acyltransferase [Dehalococcoidia bacterium]